MSSSVLASAVGVDRLQPGDHAFLAFTDTDERWDILSVFTRQGFDRDEKVVLHVDTGASAAEVAARVAGAAAAGRALDRGQLVVSTAARFKPGEFDAVCLVDSSRRRIDAVTGEGYSGLRSTNELSLALAPAGGLDQAVEYEVALHQAIFAGLRNRRYTALCQWDARRFGAEPALQAARAVHPVTVLSRIGTLHVAPTAGGIRLTGDSDLSNRAELTAALRTLADHTADTLVLDIADLSFIDAYGVGSVLRLAAGLAAPQRLEVRCRSTQRRLLYALGGREVGQLSIITERL